MNLAQQKFLDEPVFVLGLPRSGTSMVTGVLALCGAWLGRTVPGGGRENPKGFFENIYLREGVNKKILAEAGFDPSGIDPIPLFDQLPNVNGLKKTIHDYLEFEGYGFDRPWIFKEPKLTLLWPIYSEAFPRAKWLIVKRDIEEVIESCLRTPFMNQHSTDRRFWEQWAQAYQLRLDALKQFTNNWREIDSGKLIQGNLDAMMEMSIWAGLKWNQLAAEQFITPEYWHAANS